MRALDRPSRLWHIVESPIFTTLVLVVIIANAVVLGLQTYEGIESKHGDTLNLLNDVFLAFFVVELALRMGAYGRPAAGLLPLRLERLRLRRDRIRVRPRRARELDAAKARAVVARGADRADPARPADPRVRRRPVAAAAGEHAPPDHGDALHLRMLGWLLFAEEIPQDRGNIGRAMLSLFVLLTLEDFPRYMERGMEVHQWSWIYFVTFVLITVFIVINVLIGIVLTSMEEARELERRRRLSLDREAEVGPIAPAPVMERIAILRAALDELEDELAASSRAVGA
ncbi:MAG TPA: ion transporter [Gaiellaceae bacterium]|nr:ion transporter [Gaiellaceae bacterium]